MGRLDKFLLCSSVVTGAFTMNLNTLVNLVPLLKVSLSLVCRAVNENLISRKANISINWSCTNEQWKSGEISSELYSLIDLYKISFY